MHIGCNVKRRMGCGAQTLPARFAGLSCMLLAFGITVAAGVPPPPAALPFNVEKVTVKTSLSLNREVPFYVRRPARYSGKTSGKSYRLLLIIPFMNDDGLKKVTEDSVFLKLADERDWFVVAPTFKDQRADVRDRHSSYYYPEKWSGKAVLDALEEIRRKYPVDTDRLLVQGLSGGAQFAHRFAIAVPEKITAVAVNSSSWFDSPNEQSVQVAWLVTIGDSDPSYENSLKFIDQLRKSGAMPVFRSYLGMVHEGSAQVDALDGAFFSFYDDLTKASLGTTKHIMIGGEHPPLPESKMPYVGDAQDWTYGRNEPARVEEMGEDSRIYLPDETVAKLWGNPARNKQN